MGKLGYSSITLTDLTQTLPVSLTLESNLNKNIQIKTGTLYEPDFREKISPEEDFEGVVITPSLFLGQEDLEIEKNEIYVNPNFNDEARTSGFIYYEIGNTIYKYDKNITTGIYVDLQGKLHIEENLNENTTIEAYIEDFKIEVHAYTDPLVSAINPITILLLEEGSSNYQAMIDCSDGREHFEDTNASPITMTASLWKGNEQIPTEQLLYSWDKLGDGDSIVDGDESSLIVERKSITNREYFTCIITDTATGLTYSASQFIYDFTDIYACDISYNKMPLLTDKSTEITLTANVWNKGKLLESGKDGFILSYDWFARGIVSEEEVVLIENNTSPILELNISNIPKLQYQDFVVYCKVYQTDSAGTRYSIAGGTLNIHYTIQYSVKVTPQTFFVSTSSTGSYQDKESKKYNFTFQLLDSNGVTLPYEKENSATPVGNQSDGTIITFTQIEEGKWNFTGEMNFTNSTFWEQTNLTSQIYEFTYTYLGQKFSEEINVVKSYIGEQGFSGYTIDLSNEFHAFSGGEGQADSDQSTSCSVSAYFGTDKKKIKKISIGDNILIYGKNNEDDATESIYKKNIDYNFGENNSYLFFSTSPGNGESIDINIRTNNSESEDEKSFFLKDIKPISFHITIEDDKKDLTFLKIFSYTINYNGKAYRLNINPTNIKYSEASGKYDPSSIEVSALARGESGEATFYEKGKIIYSFNEKDWSYLGNQGSITGYRGLEKVHIRLYSGQASISEGNIDLENNEKYLLDRETIPVLTSLEGYEIGGENLLQWSKTIPLEVNKWRTSGEEYLTIEKDGDFSIMNFNTMEEGEDDRWYCFVSPKISLTSDMIGKQYCLSFLFYGENLENFNNQNHFSFELASFKDFNSTTRDAFGVIGYISGNKENSDYLSSEELENSKWCKIYKIFTLDDSFFNRSDNKIDTDGDNSADTEIITPLEECNYLSVYFFMKNKGKIKIKKPKLEMGNIVSAWSENPEDIFYNTFEEQNLISDSYEFILKYESTLVSSNLLPNTTYALSWQNVDSIAGKSLPEKITYGFYDIEQNEITLSNALSYGKIELSSQQSNAKNITLHSPENLKSLKLYFFIAEKDFVNGSETDLSSYNGTEILFNKIKLEKGFVSTSYIISDSQWEKINEALKQSTNQNSIDIQTTKGDIITIQQTDLPNYLAQLNKTQTNIEEGFTQINTSLTTMNSALGAKIGEVESLFKVVTDLEQGGPYIELLVKQPENGTTNQNFQMRLTNTKLGFYSSDNIKTPENGEDFFSANALAYFSKDKLFIKQADILDTIRIGREENGGFLVITTTFTDGITFTWENQ